MLMLQKNLNKNNLLAWQDVNKFFLTLNAASSRFEVKPLALANQNEVITLMKHHYLKDSLFQYVSGMTPSDFVHYETERFKTCMLQDYAFGVFEKSSSRLVATAFNKIVKSQSKGDFAQGYHEGSNPMQVYKRFVGEISANTFEFLDADNIYLIGGVTVHSDYRRLGLGANLTKCSRYEGSKSGCKYLVARPSSEYAIKLVLRIKNYTVLKEMKFADYVDPVTGLNPFAEAKFPHLRIQVGYVKLK